MRLTRALGCLLVACGTCATAADTALDISQYRRATWRTADGFVGGAHIWAIVQTPDGYLWLGTERGLFRFDGVTATRWLPPGGKALPHEYISSLRATRDGSLWIGMRGGLVRWRGDEVTPFPQLDGNVIDSILEDREGTVWISTQRFGGLGQLCAVRTAGMQCEGQDGRFGGGVGSLLEDRAGRLWVNSLKGLWRWRPEPPRAYSIMTGGDAFHSLADDRDGTLLLTTLDGLRRIVGDRIEPVPLPAGARARLIMRDSRGALWISTYNDGLLHLHDGRIDAFGRPDGYGSESAYRFMEDREGNVWVSDSEGLGRFTEPAAAAFSWRQGLADRRVSAVLSARDGSVWLGTGAGLYRWRDGALSVYRENAGKPANDRSSPLEPHAAVIASGLPDGYVSALFEDRHGRIWISTRKATGYLDKDHFVVARGIGEGMVDSIAEDRDGTLWLSHRERGLVRWASGAAPETIPWSRFGASRQGYRLAADARAGVWVGFVEGGLARWADGAVRESYGPADGLSRVNDLRVAADGAIWIATATGLARLKDRRVAMLNAKGGLPCDSVDSMSEDATGDSWLYMECGFAHVARRQLDTWTAAVDRGAAPPTIRVAALLSDSDGVRTSQLRGTASPHVARAADGRFWLASQEGAMVVDPARLRINDLPPPVHVERVVADRTTHEDPVALQLPPLVRDLQIDYTALSFVAPEKTRFRYRLEGYDRAWMDVGTRRQAFFSALPPGSYRFQVIASNNSGVWNEKGATLDFTIAPAWWQTTWFRVSFGVAVALLLIVAYRLRVAHLRRRFNETLDTRVNERMRIARDLHDTLLQSFHGVLLKFQTASSLLPARPAEAKDVLDRAIDQAANAVTEGRDAVQGLRTSATEMNDLADAIRTMGETLAAEHGNGDAPALRVEVHGASRALHPILRDEVFRIAGEALRNAFHHAHAKQVEVEIRYDERRLRLRVRDDGKGIDSALLAQGARAGHFGLPGMRERAKSIDGKLTVWSAQDAGTEVELAIPASRAYSAATMESGE
jgi:signal transduction histidine kinase/ligand-binding sensor domain-containing protein